MQVQQLQATTNQQPILLTSQEKDVGAVLYTLGGEVASNELRVAIRHTVWRCQTWIFSAQPIAEDLDFPNLSLRRCRCPCRKDLRWSSTSFSSGVSRRDMVPRFWNSSHSTFFIFFVKPSACCLWVGTQNNLKAPCSSISLATKRSNMVCLSAGTCPVVCMWSYNDLASVMMPPPTFMLVLHSGVTSYTPRSNMSTNNLLYRCLSTAKDNEQLSAAILDRTTLVDLAVL